MFQSVQPAPPDPILGLTEAFGKDDRPNKINLSVGVYKDEAGHTPVLGCVKQAERTLVETETTKSYKPIGGDPAYARLVQNLIFGKDHPLVGSGRLATVHTPGGTGALRVAGDYLYQNHDAPTLYLSDPTWANHAKIYASAQLPTKTYAYFDPARNGLNFEAMQADLAKVEAGQVVLLHGCCHNPTGADPSIEQWHTIGKLLAERGALPLVDFAYQGFGDGLAEDAAGLRALLEHCDEAIVASSFSKNFGLYNERVGALTVVAPSEAEAAAVLSRIKVAVRTNYSNPPAHGAAVVQTVLEDAKLTAQWDEELAGMRRRIHAMRQQLVAALKQAGAKRDYGFIEKQRGMFSFSGLDKAQVEKLKAEHAIYIVGSGRINVAGLSEQNVAHVAEAMVAVGA